MNDSSQNTGCGGAIFTLVILIAAAASGEDVPWHVFIWGPLVWPITLALILVRILKRTGVL